MILTVDINNNSNKQSYDIDIKDRIELKKDITTYIQETKNYNKIAVIIDSNVNKLYNDKINLGDNCTVITINAGESSKNINQVAEIIDKLSEINFTRKDLIVAVGGGVVGDIAGFVSSIYMRGVDFVQVPTTLLAMVDSSIGGKTGVDTSYGKNLIGTFYQPKKVYIYTEFLNTLDEKQMNTGFAEIIKHSLIQDKSMFEYLETSTVEEIKADIKTLIYNNCKIKSSIVEKDVDEQGLRMILNFGHTIGHAIEQQTNFSYTHGEAVAIGMAEITNIAVKKGLVNEEVYNRIRNVLIKFNLPYEYYINDDLINIMKSDKKMSSDKLNYILVSEIGNGYIYKDDLSFLR